MQLDEEISDENRVYESLVAEAEEASDALEEDRQKASSELHDAKTALRYEGGIGRYGGIKAVWY